MVIKMQGSCHKETFYLFATLCPFHAWNIFYIALILLTRQKPDPTLGRTSCQGQVPCKAKFVLRLSSVTLCGLCQYRSKHPWFDCGCSILRLGPRNDSLTEVLHLQMWRLWRTEGRQLSPQAEAWWSWLLGFSHNVQTLILTGNGCVR